MDPKYSQEYIFIRSLKIIKYRLYKMSALKIGQDLNGETDGDSFGFALSISENGFTIVSGAPNLGNKEYARMYTFDPDTELWKQIGQDIISENTNDFDLTGNSVSLSANGQRVVVGSPVSSPSPESFADVTQVNKSESPKL